MLLEKPVSLQQHLQYLGRIYMTGRNEEIRVPKDIKGTQGLLTVLRGKSTHEPLGVLHLKILPWGLWATRMPQGLYLPPLLWVATCAHSQVWWQEQAP